MSKQSSKQQVMAIVSIGYNYIMLPLDKAHELQKILASDDVLTCSQDWARLSDRTHYTVWEYNPPTVEIAQRNREVIDLTMLTDSQRNDYTREVLAPYREGTSDVRMGVKEWLALRGEN